MCAHVHTLFVQVYRCHDERVKSLSTSRQHPFIVWSAGEDGTLRQHDLREPAVDCVNGGRRRPCPHVLFDMRRGPLKDDDSPDSRVFPGAELKCGECTSLCRTIHPMSSKRERTTTTPNRRRWIRRVRARV